MTDGALARTEEWRRRAADALPDELFAGFRSLFEEVDAATAAFVEAYPGDEVHCKAGCSECCRSFFEVGLVGGFYLLKGVARLPEERRIEAVESAYRALQAIGETRQAMDPHARAPEIFVKDLDLAYARSLGGVFCSLLTAEGACGIYPWRPVVCRYYGFPRPHAVHPDELDYCYLNFRGLRARGEEPDRGMAMDVARWRKRLDALEGELAGHLFGAPGLRYSAPIAEYVASAPRTLEEWADFLAPLATPAFLAVRRFFEVLGAREETRRNALDPFAMDRSIAWAEEHLEDPGLAEDMDRVVGACLDRLSGTRIDGRAVAGILRRRGGDFRRHAFLVALQTVQEAAGD